MTKNKKYNKAFFSIHLAVLLFGMAGVFGKLIALPAVLIVLGRVVFASIFLGSIITIKRNKSFILKNKKDYYWLFLQGALLAFHWFSFFHSIQLSSVAIGLLTFATFPVFSSFIEPFFFKEAFERIYLFLAAISLFAIFLIIPEISIGNNETIGVFWGILSGLSFAFLTILNRKFVQKIGALKISFFQDMFATILLLPFLFILPLKMDWNDFYLLILLGVIFTGFAHYLFIKSLQKVNVRTASIIANLEPVYGIILAYFLVNENPAFKTLLGGGIIVFISLYLSLRKNKMS